VELVEEGAEVLVMLFRRTTEDKVIVDVGKTNVGP
jgi:hypothetical protein